MTQTPLPRFIKTNLGMYWRALETKDFVYYVNYQEGDENACVKMYRKENFELLSDNYFGFNDFFETLVDKKDYTYISKTMKYNLKLHNEASN